MTHTKEPWKVVFEQDWPFDPTIMSGDEVLLHERRVAHTSNAKTLDDIRTAVGWHGDDRDEVIAAISKQEAKFARIVSCVNALAGLNPDAVADVVAAAEALIKNRDENCSDREEYKQGGKYGDYWSPAASMVNSEHVAALRTALARIRGEG